MELIIFDMDSYPWTGWMKLEFPLSSLTSQSEWEISQEETSTLEVTYDFLCKPFTQKKNFSTNQENTTTKLKEFKRSLKIMMKL